MGADTAGALRRNGPATRLREIAPEQRVRKSKSIRMPCVRGDRLARRAKRAPLDVGRWLATVFVRKERSSPEAVSAWPRLIAERPIIRTLAASQLRMRVDHAQRDDITSMSPTIIESRKSLAN